MLFVFHLKKNPKEILMMKSDRKVNLYRKDRPIVDVSYTCRFIKVVTCNRICSR